MLFDLRGRGRRSAVRVIYTGLAVLMAVGLVGFGIGGGFGGGGFLNAASNNEGGPKSSFADQIKKYKRLTARQPQNPSAWVKLLRAQLREAGGETYFQNGQLTSKGQELYSAAAATWSRYLALNPSKPNGELAALMVRVLGSEGLNEPGAAVQALQIVVAARPASAALYGELAEYAYKAHNTREGDLAAAKAEALAAPLQRPALKKRLEELKKNPEGNGQSVATPTSSTSGQSLPGATTPSSTTTKAPTGGSSGKKK
jgi:hypothetical protein